MAATDRYVTLEGFLTEEFGVSSELLTELLNDPTCLLRNARDIIQPRHGLVSLAKLRDELTPVVIAALQMVRLRRLKKIHELQAEVKVCSEIDVIIASKFPKPSSYEESKT